MGVNEISGNYSNLAVGFEKLGLKVTFVVARHHPFGYGKASEIPRLDSLPRLHTNPLVKLFFALLPKRLRRLLVSAIDQVLRLRWAIKVVRTHDSFIFGFGSSLLPWNLDLPVLAALGKRTISCLHHGSEARAPWADGAWLRSEEEELTTKEIVRLVRKTRRRVLWHEQWVDFVVGNLVSTATFATKPMVNEYMLGRPVLPRSHTAQTRAPRQETKILHVPSHAPAKGTAQIEKMLKDLSNQGCTFDYVRLEGQTNETVISALSDADLVIDQMYSDRFWSKLAAEAASVGTPVLVGGYVFDFLNESLPSHLIPPGFYCTPEQMHNTLRDLLLNRRRLKVIGEQAADFVGRQCRPERVAQNYSVLIEGNGVPEFWFEDPFDQRYFLGVGQSAQRTLRNFDLIEKNLESRA